MWKLTEFPCMNAWNEWVRTKWKTWVKHKWWINYYNVVSDLKEVGSKSSAVISQYVINHSCIKVVTEQSKVQKGPWNKSELTNQICREQLDVLLLHHRSYTGNHSYSGSGRFCRSMQTSGTFSNPSPPPKKSLVVLTLSPPFAPVNVRCHGFVRDADTHRTRGKSVSWDTNPEPWTEATPFKIAIYLQSTKAQKEIKQNKLIKNLNTLWSC